MLFENTDPPDPLGTGLGRSSLTITINIDGTTTDEVYDPFNTRGPNVTAHVESNGGGGDASAVPEPMTLAPAALGSAALVADLRRRGRVA